MKRFLFFLSIITFNLPISKAQDDLFPEMTPWTRETEIRTFDTETLWEYINGAAEYYLRFGFQKLEVVEYALNENNYIKAELYWHSSPLNTFGIYAFERPSDGNFLNIGKEGYKAVSALNFYSGYCYVKIHSNQTDSLTLKTIEDIATAISEKLANQSEGVAELRLLPEKYKVAHSEKYIPENFLGYKLFKNVVTATYRDEKCEYELFCILHQSDSEGTDLLKRYAAQMKADTIIYSDTVYSFDDRFNGQISMIVTSKMLMGVVNASNNQQSGSILQKILSE